MSDDIAAPKTPPARPRRLGSLIIYILLAAAVVGGAAGGYFAYAQRGPAAAPAPDPGVVALDPFVVNLADPGGQRFLRVSLSLVTSTREQAAELGENELSQTRARSSIIELLSAQHGERLVTPDGKAELKKLITERVTHALEHAEVTDVLFTEFVVQF